MLISILEPTNFSINISFFSFDSSRSKAGLREAEWICTQTILIAWLACNPSVAWDASLLAPQPQYCMRPCDSQQSPNLRSVLICIAHANSHARDCKIQFIWLMYSLLFSYKARTPTQVIDVTHETLVVCHTKYTIKYFNGIKIIFCWSNWWPRYASMPYKPKRRLYLF